jgi:ABC-2 type transport system ATP-binding protein
MQQKLALACAFVKDTPLLLLDEPTLGLDVSSSHELRSQIKELATEGGRTIVLSSHDMAVVEDTCERVVIINHGRVITDDSVANLIGLFKARAYRLSVNGLDPSQRATLAAAFPMIRFTDTEEHTVIEVEFPDGRGFYRLVDVLRERDTEIESIDRRDPNLEEIFLRIVASQPAPVEVEP